MHLHQRLKENPRSCQIFPYGFLLQLAGTTCSVSLDKIWQFGQIHLTIWTNIFDNLDKYIPDLYRLISSVGGWEHLASLFSLPNNRIIAPDSPLTYDWWIATNQTSQRFALRAPTSSWRPFGPLDFVGPA